MSTVIYGQSKLLKLINSFTFETLPNAMLFLGKEGCGKTTFAQHLAENLGLEFIHIKKDHLLSADELADHRISPFRKLVAIDLRGLLEKNQNMFLKFIEEPSANIKIIVIANSSFEVLPTILNRCTTQIFEPYSKEELLNFSWMHPDAPDFYYEICDTPGAFIYNSPNSLINLHTKCAAFIEELPVLSYIEVLSFSSNINFKDNYDKADPDMFLIMMHYLATKRYTEDGLPYYFNIIKLTSEYLYQIITIPTLVKENLIVSYLTRLLEVLDNDSIRTKA